MLIRIVPLPVLAAGVYPQNPAVPAGTCKKIRIMVNENAQVAVSLGGDFSNGIIVSGMYGDEVDFLELDDLMHNDLFLRVSYAPVGITTVKVTLVMWRDENAQQG